jgi:hypothetical protein
VVMTAFTVTDYQQSPMVCRYALDPSRQLCYPVNNEDISLPRLRYRMGKCFHVSISG